MSKTEFKPEDFDDIPVGLTYWGNLTVGTKQYLADQANKRLAQMMEDAVVVYGHSNALVRGGHIFFSGIQQEKFTHKALLINIEPIVKEPCKHEKLSPPYYSNDWRMYAVRCQNPMCGVELVATWQEKK